MRRPLVFVVTLAVGGALVTAISAAQGEPLKMLAAKEIRAKLIRRDFTDGIRWSWYLRPDGVLISVAMAKDRIGSWKIQDNKLCRAREKGEEPECFEVWASGKNISLRYMEDMRHWRGLWSRIAGGKRTIAARVTLTGKG